MIRVPEDTPLSVANIKQWVKRFRAEMLPNLYENQGFYLNSRQDTLPYAKKIVTISSAATLGDGITIEAPEGEEDSTLSKGQQATLARVQKLFKRQTIDAEDLAVIAQGCTYGFGYELCYMSNDDNPVPKCKQLSPLNTLVIFDDTAEENSLYGLYFCETTEDKKECVQIFVYDNVYKYEIKLSGSISTFSDNSKSMYDNICFGCPCTVYDPVENVIHSPLPESMLLSAEEHKMGRMPITMYFNNTEEQGDFEQVKPTIIARNKVNDLAMSDAETIADNILTLVGNELDGETDQEKAVTMRKINKTKILELLQGDAKYLTKTETFSMISVFGKDLENKIYDLSMVVNFTSEEFAGNASSISLRLKLFPFKRMVKNKDYFVKKLYHRRIKMYMDTLVALNPNEYQPFDVGELEITIHRTWEENILELAQVIATLYSTSLFSNEYLIEKMPDGEYEVEVGRKAKEQSETSASNIASGTIENPFFNSLTGLLGRTNGSA